MNGISVCQEEIALEGLDGITLSILWKRLNSVTPRLLSTLDDSYKAFLWKSIVSSENVQIFLLENPRDELLDFRDDENIYPFCCINDEARGFRGSCSTFHTREFIDVTCESLDVVEQKYGNRLALVASQVLREKVLFGEEGLRLVEVTESTYCLLEWIGRARRLGRSQSASVLFNGSDAAANFHRIKNLQQSQLVTKQRVYEGNNRTSILYLARFHVEHCKYSLSFRICHFVEAMSNDNLSLEYLFSHFDEPNESVKEVVDKLCETGHIQLLNIHESNDCFSEDEECQVTNVIKLVKPFSSLTDDDDVEEEEEEEEDESEEEILFVGKQRVALNLHAEVPIYNWIYQLVESKGITGETLVGLDDSVGLGYYQTRSVLTYLESQQKVTVIFEDIGKHRVSRYISTKILEQHRKLKEEADKEGENVEPEESNNDASTPADNVDNTCTVERLMNTVNILEASKNNSLLFTEKFQKRRNVVIDFLSREKVVNGHTELHKLIIEKEAESGSVEKIDKKTLIRFLEKLKETGYIQILNIAVEVEGKSHNLSLVCDLTVQEDSQEVVTIVSKCKERLQKKMKDSKVKLPTQLNLNHVIGYNNKLGFLPKMPRCEMLHVFLFYLLYELVKPDVNIKAWRQKFEWAEHLIPKDVPKDLGEGWFTAASIVLLLPLSLFVKIIGVTFQVDIIDQCINNPATKHMLIKDLPAVERQYLLYRMRHFPKFLENLLVMAEFNLITPTTKIPFQYNKDIACHLNKIAGLLDTRECIPHYHQARHPDGEQFPEMVFHLASLSDVKHYWCMVRVICLATPLGAKSADKQEPAKKKRTTLREYVKDEEDVHANNTSIKPHGDCLGAAGVDSSFYCHLKRNWTWLIGKAPDSSEDSTSVATVNSIQQDMFDTVAVPAETVSKHTGGKGKKRKHSKHVKDKNAKKIKVPKKDVQMCEASYQRSLDSEVKSDDVSKKKQAMKKTTAGKIRSNVKKIRSNAKKIKKRAHWSVKHHDERDIEAAKQNEFLRVTFTAQEQKLLFICILALRILGKKSTDTCYSDWLWIRDIFYNQNYEHAKAKTAISISRKYRSMLQDPQTKVNLNICTSDCVHEKEFQPYCNLARSCDEKSFNALVELLKKKYSIENTQTKPLSLPHSMETIKRKNNLQSGLQPKNPEKSDKDIISLKAPVNCLAHIRRGVIRDSIVSNLLMENEKYDPSATYTFLDQFVEEDLSSAVRELKKRHLLTKRSFRSTRYGNVNLRIGAVAAFSKSLSATGQRVLNAHLPNFVIDEAVSFYHQLQHGRPHSRELLHSGSVEKSAKPQSFTLLDDTTLGGHVACILTLLAIGKLSVEIEVPENSLRVEFGDKKKLEEERQVNHGEKNSDSPVISQADSEQENVHREMEPLLVNRGTDAVGHTSAEGSIDEEAKDNDREIDSLLVEQTSSFPVYPFNNSTVNTQERKLTSKPETFVVVGEDGTNLNNANIDTARNEILVHNNNNNNNKKIGEASHSSESPYSKRGTTQTILDVNGIEDHLFGSYGPSHNVRMHKLSLQSKSTFICHLITPHGDSIAHEAGDLLSNVERNVGPHPNISSNDYNDNLLSSRNTGSNIRKRVITTNNCSIKLSLLSSEEVASPCKSRGVLGGVVEHSQVNPQTVPERLEECKNICSKEFGFTEGDCLALTAVYQSIASRNEIGLSCSDADEMIKRQGFLSQHPTERLIDVLKASSLVCEVGFVEVRFVSCNFKDHWSLRVPVAWNVSEASTKMNEDGSAAVTQTGMVSCGTQTDKLTVHSVNCKHVSSLVNSNLSLGTCVKSHDVSSLEKPKEDKLMVQRNENLACANVPANACRRLLSGNELEVVSKCNAGKKEEGPVNTRVQQSSPISRPWFCMDGQINKKAYNTFHKSVLCYIMRYPGVKEFTITKHFVSMIYPVAMRTILQTLEESQCIQKRFFYKKTTSLFSANNVCSQDFVEENKVTYFLPTGDTVIQFINHVLL